MTAAPANRFVGRHAELNLLRAALASAHGSDGRLVVLLGEPGIGKTGTAAAVAAEAHAGGFAVCWGRCHENGAAPAYWPWVQALRAGVDAIGAPARELEAVLPALRGTTALSDSGDAPERARFELFYRVAMSLAAATRAQPLVLVLDDIHWADLGSLRLLELVARELASMRLLILATARDATWSPSAEVGSRLAALLRLAQCLPLAGLPPAEVRDLLTDRLGRLPADGVVDEVVRYTDGNPFFVIEMLHLIAGDRLDAPATRPALPPGVQELLRRRLEQVSPSTRDLLDVAAVVGANFEIATLAAVLGEPADRVLDRLAPAQARGLVRQVAAAPLRYAFTHALTHQNVYDGLTPSVRMALHADVATALEAGATADGGGRETLAHHFFAAAPGTASAKAIRYACEAGEHALEVLAYEEAVRHFERARAAAGAADDATRVRLLSGLGEAVHGTGDLDGAEALFQEAIALARTCGTSALAETVLRYSNVRAEFGVTDAEMNALLDEAIAALPPTASAVRARLTVRLAAGLCLQPGAERRRHALADEATAMARALDDPATLAYVLARRLIGLLGPDTLDERLATTDEILASKSSTRSGRLSALVFRADDLAHGGDRHALDSTLASFEQQAQASRQPFFLWMTAMFRTTMALLEGRFSEVEGLANHALTLGQAVQGRTAFLYHAEQVFMVRGWQGRFDEIGPVIEMSVAMPGVVPAWRCTLAEFYSLSGRTVEARRELDALAADGFAALPRDATWMGAMDLLASLCTRLGDARRAAELYDLMRPFAGRIAVAWPLVALLGVVDERLGMLASTCERYDAAEEHFTQALVIAERMRALPWQAHVRYQWAAMLMRRGGQANHDRARRLLAEAEPIARAVGMPLLLGWIEQTLVARSAAARASEPVPTDPPNTGTGASSDARAGAFRLDGDVWSIMFDGRTTRMRNMLGLAHIARLLQEPEHEVHVLDLASRTPALAASSTPLDVLDGQARATYQARVRDARAELAEAERLNDRGQAERLSEEIEFLTAELERALGIGGRMRRVNPTGERARVAVTRAIKYAVDRLAEHDPALAEHLRVAVRTGTFCSYTPPVRDRVTWKL